MHILSNTFFCKQNLCAKYHYTKSKTACKKIKLAKISFYREFHEGLHIFKWLKFGKKAYFEIQN